jgi:hypothetical protein
LDLLQRGAAAYAHGQGRGANTAPSPRKAAAQDQALVPPNGARLARSARRRAADAIGDPCSDEVQARCACAPPPPPSPPPVPPPSPPPPSPSSAEPGGGGGGGNGSGRGRNDGENATDSPSSLTGAAGGAAGFHGISALLIGALLIAIPLLGTMYVAARHGVGKVPLDTSPRHPTIYLSIYLAIYLSTVSFKVPLWCKLHFSHSNPRAAWCYLSKEERWATPLALP